MRAANLVGTAASLVVVACTVAAGGPASATSTVASPKPGLTATAARGEAAKINLVHSDLPGWSASPNVETSSDDAMSDRLAECAGAQDPEKIDVADVYSPYFDQGNTEVSSDVTVVRDRSDALQDFGAMKGEKLLPCLQEIFIQYMKKQTPKGATVSGFQVAVLAPHWLPEYSFAFRVRLTISAKAASGVTATEDLVSDEYGLLVGETEVELSTSESSPKGFAVPGPALEQRLFRLLQSRADQHAGSL